jgi:hypothetical protein
LGVCHASATHTYASTGIAAQPIAADVKEVPTLRALAYDLARIQFVVHGFLPKNITASMISTEPTVKPTLAASHRNKAMSVSIIYPSCP